MSGLLIVSKEISPNYSKRLTHAINQATGETPSLLALHGGTQSEKFRHRISTLKPRVVLLSSLDCLDEADIREAADSGITISAYVCDLWHICQRGRLYECDRAFCRTESAYERAKCFASSLPAVARGLTGAKLFKKCLPEGRAEHETFLKICRYGNAREFEFRLEEKDNVIAIEEERSAALRLLACMDFLICPNGMIADRLYDFGVERRNINVDSTIVTMEGDGPESSEAFDAHIASLARGYAAILEREAVAKKRVECENRMLMIRELSEGKTVWESRPAHIELSANNRCNLRCLMCSPESRPEEAELNEEETRDICDQVFPKASMLTPSAGSEPLMGDFEVITEMAGKHSVQLNVITNGVLLNPKKYEMMRDILGRLQVSFDAHEKETYEKIRVGAKFERVSENIREVCKLAAQDGIEVMTSAVIMNLNWNKMAEYVDYVAELGVDTVALQKLLINFPALEAWDISKTVPQEELQREIDRAIKRAEEREINLHIGLGTPRVYMNNKKSFRLFKLDYLPEPVLKRFPKFCYFVAIYAKIDPDGSVYPCCRAPKDLLMGNIKEESFDEIWNGKKYRQLRKEFFSGKLRKTCRGCPLLGIYAE